MTQTYQGKSSYWSDIAKPSGLLLVAVPCRVGDLAEPEIALLDTASHWCLLPSSLALTLGCDLIADADTHLHTRFGRLSGRLSRFPLFLLASAGETAEVDATWFISPDWSGPMVIGWKGCLERVRFGLDPSNDSFYFAAL